MFSHICNSYKPNARFVCDLLIPRHEGEARVARDYESRSNRALVHNYFIARKYCVLFRYFANNYINDFPANTFFYAAYQTISDIQFISTGRVAPVTGYK